jgi:hypothetical protein
VSSTLKAQTILTGQHIKRPLMIFTLHKVEEDQVMMFQDNGLLIDTLFFLHQEFMINLKLKLVFTLRFLGLEDFHKKYNSAILEQLMDPIVKILDHFRLSGDRLKIFILNQKVEP